MLAYCAELSFIRRPETGSEGDYELWANAITDGENLKWNDRRGKSFGLDNTTGDPHI